MPARTRSVLGHAVRQVARHSCLQRELQFYTQHILFCATGECKAVECTPDFGKPSDKMKCPRWARDHFGLTLKFAMVLPFETVIWRAAARMKHLQSVASLRRL